MKKLFTGKSRRAALLSLAGGLALVLAAGVAEAGSIKDSKHNLGSSTSAVIRNNKVTDTDEICVFCHTPHGADTSVAGAPLWNKKLTTGPFTPYGGSLTLDGKISTSLAPVSVVCLSCHDGTQALDNIINAPGSGGLDSTGGGATGRAYTWSADTGGTLTVDATGKFLTGAAANLGTNLADDHPIGIQYCGGGIDSTKADGTVAASASCNDKDFKDVQKATVNGSPVFWVDTAGTGFTGTAGSREKTDMILYTRTAAYTGQVNPEPFVECASCHDVHNGGATTQLFLRMSSNTGSQVCLACHIK